MYEVKHGQEWIARKWMWTEYKRESPVLYKRSILKWFGPIKRTNEDWFAD